MKSNISQIQATSRQMSMFGAATMNHEAKLIPCLSLYSLQPEYSRPTSGVDLS